MPIPANQARTAVSHKRLPADMPEMAFWFDAPRQGYSNGASVTVLKNLAPNGEGFDLKAGTAPTYVTNVQNGLSVVRFAGASSQYLQATDTYPGVESRLFEGDPNSWSAMWVAKITDNSNAAQVVFGKYTTPGQAGPMIRGRRIGASDMRVEVYSTNAGATTTYNAYGDTNINATWAIVWIEFTSATGGGSASMYVNGVAQNLNTSGGTGTGIFSGNTSVWATNLTGSTQYPTMDLGELMIFTALPTATQRLNLQRYASERWGITVS